MIADLDEEPWKNQALSGVVAPPMHKAERIFGPRIRDRARSSPFALRGDPREDRAWRLRAVRVQGRTDS